MSLPALSLTIERVAGQAGFFRVLLAGRELRRSHYPLRAICEALGKSNHQDTLVTVRVCGELTLDYVPVRVIADIELPSMKGKGHLEVIGGQMT